MSEIFKKLLLKKETPFLSKIVHFRYKIAWISDKRPIHRNPETRGLIICHKEVPPAVLVKSRTRTPDDLLVSCFLINYFQQNVWLYFIFNKIHFIISL